MWKVKVSFAVYLLGIITFSVISAIPENTDEKKTTADATEHSSVPLVANGKSDSAKLSNTSTGNKTKTTEPPAKKANSTVTSTVKSVTVKTQPTKMTVTTKATTKNVTTGATTNRTTTAVPTTKKTTHAAGNGRQLMASPVLVVTFYLILVTKLL